MLGNWVGDNWQGKPDLSCGTTACACGWATTLPKFRKMGLKLNIRTSGAYTETWISYGDNTRSDAIASFFGLKSEEVEFLFIPYGDYNKLRHKELLPPTAKPYHIARRIRAFIKHDGIFRVR